jgi:hypothetical protein
MRREIDRVHGLKATGVIIDESSHITDAMAYALGSARPAPTVKPEQVPCRYCGAEPGAHCQRWRRTRRGKVRQNRDSPHPDRRYDAKCATEAVRALNPR